MSDNWIKSVIKWQGGKFKRPNKALKIQLKKTVPVDPSKKSE